MRLCQLLDHWMSENKITVRALAREIGVDHTLLHRFRHGEVCNTRALVKILGWVLATKEKA